VIFADEKTLEIDEEATARQRAELLGARDRHGSLNDLFSREAGRLIPSRSPTSEAGNRAFGLG
jgi:hypothetical protein